MSAADGRQKGRSATPALVERHPMVVSSCSALVGADFSPRWLRLPIRSRQPLGIPAQNQIEFAKGLFWYRNTFIKLIYITLCFG